MYDTGKNADLYLSATDVIDSDNPSVLEFAEQKAGDGKNDIEKACALFEAVRDEIVYDPRSYFYHNSHYRASTILKNKKGYCVSKACLLCALGRALSIPTRLGFADIRNHGASPDIIELMGTDIFAFHGFVEFLLEGRWVKATPAFDRPVYEKHQIPLVTFNGREDAVFPSHDLNGKPYVEYVKYHGSFADLPLDDLLKSFRDTYGEERIALWMEMLESA